jgi:hypothetical protein
VPPVAEIAKIAAVLASKFDIRNPHDLKFVAGQSIALWEQCEAARKSRIDILAMYARAEAWQNELPKPKSYPVKLDDFLKLLMPQKRVEDRMSFYREYLTHSIRVVNHMRNNADAVHTSIDSTPTPSGEEVSKCIAQIRERQFSRASYPNSASDFLRWLSQNEGIARHKRAQAGAAARKTKRQKNG